MNEKTDHANTKLTLNHHYRDRVFRLLFGAEYKENLLSLYNALNDSHHTDLDDLTITTLDDAIFMSMKNDVSFIIDHYSVLFEHQSTWTPNMPLRGFLYAARVYSSLTGYPNRAIYDRRLLKIPTPQYYVFYNGTENRPEKETLRLSDAFLHPVEKGAYEWTAHVLNINVGKNKELFGKCRVLEEYSLFMDMVRKERKRYNDPGEAVLSAIDSCIRDGILTNFLRKHREEVKMDILTEFDEELFKKTFREEGYEDGVAEGEAKGAFLTAWKAYEQKIATAEQAAGLAEMTVEEFLAKGRTGEQGKNA